MTQAFAPVIDGTRNLCVQLDGCVIGWASPKACQQIATTLRVWKTEGTNEVPLDLEIGFVPVSKGGQYPGLYLFSSKARMMRPVKYVANGRDDSVGSFEQVYMDIACSPEEIEDGVSTYVEHAPTNFLSILANLTPFSDFNQVRITACLSGFQNVELHFTVAESPKHLPMSDGQANHGNPVDCTVASHRQQIVSTTNWSNARCPTGTTQRIRHGLLPQWHQCRGCCHIVYGV